jgi:hypothetical protein
MALPVQSTPIYSLIVPSTKETLKYRPFLIKEQKSLLSAQQSEDISIMLDTLRSVIQSCVQGTVDVGALAIFDLEYMFSQIRAKSVGETVDLLFLCDVCDVEDAKVKITIDLTKLEVEQDPDHTKKISLFDDVGVVMKYPSLDNAKKLSTIREDDVEAIFKQTIESIDYIYDSKEIYYAKEQSTEELEAFINNLTDEQFQGIKRFFETMPSLAHRVEYSCPVCRLKHNKKLEGINSFF